MTVGELIIILGQFDKDLPVFTHENEGMFLPLTKVSERWMREESGTFEILDHDSMATSGDLRGIPL